jgi:hypothetical protein
VTADMDRWANWFTVMEYPGLVCKECHDQLPMRAFAAFTEVVEMAKHHLLYEHPSIIEEYWCAS